MFPVIKTTETTEANALAEGRHEKRILYFGCIF